MDLGFTNKNQNILKAELEKIRKKVRLLAGIQDMNVLRYYNSWIESSEETKFNSMICPEIGLGESLTRTTRAFSIQMAFDDEELQS